MGMIQSSFNKLLMSSLGLAAGIGKSQAFQDKRKLKEAEATVAEEKGVQEAIKGMEGVDPDVAALELQRSSAETSKAEEAIAEIRSKKSGDKSELAKARIHRAEEEIAEERTKRSSYRSEISRERIKRAASEALAALESGYQNKRSRKAAMKERIDLTRDEETAKLLKDMGVNLSNIKGWVEVL